MLWGLGYYANDSIFYARVSQKLNDIKHTCKKNTQALLQHCTMYQVVVMFSAFAVYWSMLQM